MAKKVKKKKSAVLPRRVPKIKEPLVSIVEAIITDEKGRVLLLKRSKNNTFFVDKWQLPGGKVKKGESLEKAIRREILEETGCKSKDLSHMKTFYYSAVFNEDVESVLLAVFSCKISGAFCLGKDHCKSRFVNLSSIKKSSLTTISKKALFG